MKYLYALLFLFSVNLGVSQSFTAQGNFWTQNGTYLSAPPTYYPIDYFVEGDTLIEEKNYSKVYYYDGFWDQTSDTLYYAAIRETVDSVWIIGAETAASEEKLIYDWSIEIGDTINSNVNGATVLGSIDIVTLLNGEERKQFNVTHYQIRFNGEIDTIYNAYYFIEGIGNINRHDNLFKIWGIEINFSENLRCFSQNGELLWLDPTVSDCTSVYTSTKTPIIEKLFSLYPNPVQDVLQIEWVENSSKVGVLSVYTSTGVSVYSERLDQSNFKTSISMTSWPKGLYFVRFVTEEGGQYVRQLVKM